MTRLLRRLARLYLFQSWVVGLPYHEAMRVLHWGTTGNPAHHPFSWVEDW